jgi:hypothetical protein
MKTSLIALLASAAYATLRYHVFKDVPWSDWPTWTLNKAFGLAALVLLVLYVKGRTGSGPDSQEPILQMAGVFASIHVMISLVLLSPAYYAGLFQESKLTSAAGVSMTLGAFAAAGMALGSRQQRGADSKWTAVRLPAVACLVGFHAFFQGFAGWLVPSKWPGTMPPLTLISFVLGLVAVALSLRHHPKA